MQPRSIFVKTRNFAAINELVEFQKLYGKYSNQNYITWVNIQASPAKNYLSLNFSMKGR